MLLLSTGKETTSFRPAYTPPSPNRPSEPFELMIRPFAEIHAVRRLSTIEALLMRENGTTIVPLKILTRRYDLMRRMHLHIIFGRLPTTTKETTNRRSRTSVVSFA